MMIASDGHGLTYEERVAVMMAAGMTESYAHFTVAMQNGEITGDLEEISEEEMLKSQARRTRKVLTSPKA